jgi:type VI secretion system protein ImpK
MSHEKDDPLAPRDVTILRPRPGAGRRPPPAAPGQPASPPPAPGYAPSPGQPAPAGYAPPGAQPPSPGYAPQPGYPQQNYGAGSVQPGVVDPVSYAGQGAGSPASLEEFTAATGSNPLVQAATPLLVLAGRLRGQIAQADIESLRRQAIQEIRTFEERARRAGVPAEDVLAARYALCTVLDEAVLNTPWGAQSNWAGHSLLVTFHREGSGGEKFFQILERVSGEPQRYLALLELLYVCLALGFEGKYRLDERGAARLSEIRQDLYHRISSLRDNVEPELSVRWKGVEDRRNAVMRFVPLWVVAAACIVVLAGAYIYFDTKLSAQAEPVNAMLARVGLESLDPPMPAAPAVATSGLRQLLAPQITAQTVSVEESGDRTLITLTVRDLFASGSDKVDARYDALVNEVGAALAKVPGRILVIGHTDDQPLRSFRFKDNYELSRARAQQVAELLRTAVQDSTRIEVAGKGSLEPRYEPANTPENRARNRRVEIIHRRVVG